MHVRSEPDNEERLDAMTLLPGQADEGWCRWEAVAALAPHQPTTPYVFRCQLGRVQRWSSQAGLHAHPPLLAWHFRHFDGYLAPEWVWDQVVYQVFPDRFRDGDQASNVRDGAYQGPDAPHRGCIRSRTRGEPRAEPAPPPGTVD